MDMNSDKSISLSQCCVVLFALLLAALDIGGYWFVGFFIRLRGMVWQSGVLMLVSIYTSSVFGWVTLWKLWKLLGNIKAGRVFVDENVRIMRTVSRCCVAAAVISSLSALYYAPFFVIAMAEGVHGADRAHRPERLSDRDRHEGRAGLYRLRCRIWRS